MGILFGLIAGFLDGTKNVFAKKNTSTYSETTINFVWMLFATIVTLPLAFTSIPSTVSLQLIIILIAVTLLDFFAYMFYLRSIKYTDLSLSLPMLSLTPVFVLGISYLALGQTISIPALLGVICIIVGSYLLNVQKGNTNFLDPFKNIFRNQGIKYMLFTSLLWGFANSLHKVGIQDSNPLFYTGISYLFLTLLYFFLILCRHNKELVHIFTMHNVKPVAPVGILEGVTAIFQFLSQSLIPSSVISISLKRSSIIFSALFGYVFFKEKIRERIIPIVVVLFGILLIAL